MESTHPRIYAQCENCGTVRVYVLPRQERYWDVCYAQTTKETVDAILRSGLALEVVISGTEGELKASGVAQKLRWLLDERPLELGGDALRSIRNEALGYVSRLEKDIDKRREQLGELLDRAREVLYSVKARIYGTQEEAVRAARALGYQKPGGLGPVLACEDGTVSYVYALVDPLAPETIRYIGKTSNPAGRYRGHITKGAPNIKAWVAQLAREGRAPVMVQVELSTESAVNEREDHWIAHYRANGQADLNTVLPASLRAA